MSFDLRRFLKRTPVSSLRAYFERCANGLDVHACWSLSPGKRVDSLVELILDLDEKRGARVWTDFERVSQFDGESGRKALRSVVSADSELGSVLDGLEDTYACGLHVLDVDPVAFDRALAVHYATRLRNGRDWSGTALSGTKPVVLKHWLEAVGALTERLTEIFREELGNRRRLKVEKFSRREVDPGTNDIRELVQFTVYLEGLPQTTMVFDEDTEVVRQTIHPVAEAAIVLDPKERTLDITGKGGKERRLLIANTFVEAMIEGGGDVGIRARRALSLDKLKTRPMFAILPEDRVQRVDVERLCLRAPGATGGLVTIDRRNTDGGEDLYACAEHWFGAKGLPGSIGWQILAASLRIAFEPDQESRHEKRILVELKAPDRSNLREQTKRHRLIADTLLRRWGLYAEWQ